MVCACLAAEALLALDCGAAGAPACRRSPPDPPRSHSASSRERLVAAGGSREEEAGPQRVLSPTEATASPHPLPEDRRPRPGLPSPSRLPLPVAVPPGHARTHGGVGAEEEGEEGEGEPQWKRAGGRGGTAPSPTAPPPPPAGESVCCRGAQRATRVPCCVLGCEGACVCAGAREKCLREVKQKKRSSQPPSLTHTFSLQSITLSTPDQTRST